MLYNTNVRKLKLTQKIHGFLSGLNQTQELSDNILIQTQFSQVPILLQILDRP